MWRSLRLPHLEERQQHLLLGQQPMPDPSVSPAAPESGILSGSRDAGGVREERRGLRRERNGLEEVAAAGEGRALPDKLSRDGINSLAAT